MDEMSVVAEAAVSPLPIPAMPRDRLALESGQVDLWVALTGEVAERQLRAWHDAVLTADERAQHLRFMFERDRRRYLLTRALVRYVLSRYAPVAPAAWQFVPTEYGRPLIANRHPDAAELVFNISHSGQVVVIGVARGGQLGVDVEDVRREVPVHIADSFFSRREVGDLRSLVPALQPQRFLDLWTLKESYIKACGMGLSLPLDKFGFVLDAGPRLSAYFDAEMNDAAANWHLWQWRPTPDSIAALCVDSRAGAVNRITVRRTVPFVHENEVEFDVVRASSI
jgi:4'-phosphopantetheinyl transferase